MIFVPVIAPDPRLSAEGVVLRVPNDGDASWMAEACNDPDIAPVHRRDAARSVGAERRGTRRPAVHLARYETGRLDARAKLLARRGSHAQAESLAREAVALADKTEAPDMQSRRLHRPRRGALAHRPSRQGTSCARRGTHALRTQGSCGDGVACPGAARRSGRCTRSAPTRSRRTLRPLSHHNKQRMLAWVSVHE